MGVRACGQPHLVHASALRAYVPLTVARSIGDLDLHTHCLYKAVLGSARNSTGTNFVQRRIHLSMW